MVEDIDLDVCFSVFWFPASTPGFFWFHLHRPATMIVNIISSPTGGGAELLVRDLHKLYKQKGFAAKAIYFSGFSEGLDQDELFFCVNPRSPFNIFRIRCLLKKYLTESEADLKVHVHLTWPFFYVTLASLGLRGINLYYTEHNTSNRRRKVPIFRYFERLLYSRFRRIICISDGVRSSLACWVGPRIADRLVTIVNGSRIYPLATRLSLKGRKPNLVSIGSLTYKKNFATVLHALGQVSDQFDTYTLVGEGPERTSLESIILQEKLADKVKLVGWSDKIQEHLNASDIQLIPSLWEGFGLVAVEGMSTGLPVIAANVDGLREVLNPKNPAVTLVDEPESVEAWVNAINVSVVNLETQGQSVLAQFSRAQAQKFTLERMANNYLKMYRES